MEGNSDQPKPNFAVNPAIRDELARKLARPPAFESERNFERFNEEALEAIERGNYQIAAVRYRLSVAEGMLAGRAEMQIEGLLRLAGVTIKLGDEFSALQLLKDALDIRDARAPSFDFDKFIQASRREFRYLEPDED